MNKQKTSCNSLTDDAISNIINEYKGGKSIRKISEKYHIDREIISKTLKANGVTITHQRVSEQQKDYILSSNKSNKELSVELNMPLSTVKGIRNRNGHFTGKFLKDLSNEEKQQIKQDYLNGLSAKNIGDKYGWSKKSILTVLNNLGVDTSKHNTLSQEEEQFIVDNYHNASGTQLSKIFNVSNSLIQSVWMKHGLKGKRNSCYVLDEHYFSDIDTPAKAYFLGFLASDGCLWRDDYRFLVKLQLQQRDKHILELFSQEIKTNKPLIKSHSGSQFCIEVCSETMFKDLVKLGLTPRKTQVYQLQVLEHEELMPHFLRGFFDGDGCITFNQKKKVEELLPSDFTVTITGATLATQTICDYLKEQQLSPARYDVTANKYNFGCYTIEFTNNQSIYEFLTYIYKDAGKYCLKRKQDRAKLFMNIFCNKYNKPNLLK